jgi:hypothetical protein
MILPVFFMKRKLRLVLVWQQQLQVIMNNPATETNLSRASCILKEEVVKPIVEGINLNQFVDINNDPICLKYNGYYPHNFKKVPPGTCRWRGECHLSHKPPNASTFEQLEALSQRYELQQTQQRAVKQTQTARLFELPLPAWLNECRQHLLFSTNSASYDEMREAVTHLLASSWTDMKLGGVICSPNHTPLPLHHTHLTTAPLPEARIPICPALVHGFRLNGRKFPKSWTTAYKMTKKMVQKMEKTSVYERYLLAYKTFIRDVIVPLFAPYTKTILYQCPPTLRVHMPGHSPTIGMHCDADYERHEPSEVNFWIPFTRVFDSNTLWCESEPGKADFSPFELNPGEGMRFNGNTCRHFTKPNVTDCTRVSFDFRVIPADLAVRPKEYLGKIGDYPTEEISCIA